MLRNTKNIKNALKQIEKAYFSEKEFEKPENIEFPYKFGNLAGFNTSNIKIPLGPKNFVSGTKIAYKSLLSAFSSGDLSFIKNICEARLYRKIEFQYNNLLSKGYKFILRNEDADINIRLKNLNFILGGYIDRNSEFDKGISLMKEINSSLVYHDPTSESINIIAKMRADVITALKLDLKFPTGETLIPQNDLLLPEQHEIFMEGLCFTTRSTNIISGLVKMLWAAFKSEILLQEVYFVDFDYTLSGNPHKDSRNI